MDLNIDKPKDRNVNKILMQCIEHISLTNLWRKNDMPLGSCLQHQYNVRNC